MPAWPADRMTRTKKPAWWRSAQAVQRQRPTCQRTGGQSWPAMKPRQKRTPRQRLEACCGRVPTQAQSHRRTSPRWRRPTTQTLQRRHPQRGRRWWSLPTSERQTGQQTSARSWQRRASRRLMHRPLPASPRSVRLKQRRWRRPACLRQTCRRELPQWVACLVVCRHRRLHRRRRLRPGPAAPPAPAFLMRTPGAVPPLLLFHSQVHVPPTRAVAWLALSAAGRRTAAAAATALRCCCCVRLLRRHCRAAACSAPVQTAPGLGWAAERTRA